MMNLMNQEERKVQSIIERLRSALDTNHQSTITELETEMESIDATRVRQGLLDDLDELLEHENYGLPG
jgi:hypothetical protein